jgi:hypothetical protein
VHRFANLTFKRNNQKNGFQRYCQKTLAAADVTNFAQLKLFLFHFLSFLLFSSYGASSRRIRTLEHRVMSQLLYTCAKIRGGSIGVGWPIGGWGKILAAADITNIAQLKLYLFPFWPFRHFLTLFPGLTEFKPSSVGL